jgi:hypothetical protein
VQTSKAPSSLRPAPRHKEVVWKLRISIWDPKRSFEPRPCILWSGEKKPRNLCCTSSPCFRWRAAPVVLQERPDCFFNHVLGRDGYAFATHCPGPSRWPRSGISVFQARSAHDAALATPTRGLAERRKGLRGFQIGRIEAFGEPIIDRLQERFRLTGTALIPQ